MDKRTRFLNAMEGKPVDRVPVSFYTHSKDLSDNAVAEQLDWFRRCGMDALCVETDGYMEYPVSGDANRLACWSGLSLHQKEDPYIAGQLDRAKRIADGVEDGAVFFMIYTPFSTIKHTIGGEQKIMEFYREDPGFLLDVMKRIEEDTFRLMDYLMDETGIDGLFVSLQNAEEWRFSPDEYVSYLKPFDERLIAHANALSPHNILHMCSWTGVPNRLELWRDYDYQTVNWAVTIERQMNLKQGREYFRPGVTVMGGFDSTENGILYRGAREEIMAYTKEQLALAGQVGTILCGDCSVPMDLNPEHVRYVVEACEEFAKEIDK
ncbi:MAG: uroporphyrinogen decarboxylase family protein [Eubacteriales bacterium]|nr:uroporphyrinogen decarboxylase family protein [Eubacteriales bacterium]